MNSKVLYISNHAEISGYSEAARQYLLSLNYAGVNVVARRISFGQKSHPVHPIIYELENKSEKGCDVAITHSIPGVFEFSSKFNKNIGMFAWESTNFKNTGWTRKLNLMDEVWVINNQMVDACHESGVKRPIKIVPHAFDLDVYTKNYPLIYPSIFEELKSSGKFIFLFVGEFNRRKNIGALLKAFHSEFSPEDNVELVIKTSKNGLDSQTCKNEVEKFANAVKQGLHLHNDLNRFKKEIIITESLDKEDIYALHNQTDCFVSTSLGEAYCIPAMDSLGFGKLVVVGDHTGFKDYVPSELRVPCNHEVCFGEDISLYSGGYWWCVDIKIFREKMRRVYEEAKTNSSWFKNLTQQCREAPLPYSYDKIGSLMKSYINA